MQYFLLVSSLIFLRCFGILHKQLRNIIDIHRTRVVYDAMHICPTITFPAWQNMNMKMGYVLSTSIPMIPSNIVAIRLQHMFYSLCRFFYRRKQILCDFFIQIKNCFSMYFGNHNGMSFCSWMDIQKSQYMIVLIYGIVWNFFGNDLAKNTIFHNIY